MKDKIGDSFEAIISGVTENALYVEIMDLCISGSIPVEALGNDYFFFDKKNHRLFGELSTTTYQIGDFIRVMVVDVDIINKRIQFKLA
jgi:ribonuclease R